MHITVVLFVSAASNWDIVICDYTWDFICSKTGAKYIHQSTPLPVHSEDEIVNQFCAGVTSQKVSEN